MIAGLNLVGKVWRFTSSPYDDSVGGSVPSGTVAYENIPMRLAPMKPTQALVEQGLEVPLLFTGIVSPGTLVLQENDQIEVTAPATSNFYAKRFRLVGHQDSGIVSFDPRYMIVTLHRVEKAHSNEYQ